nr:PREDICTED: heat shock 70 kDa protein-like [Nicotiana sylvestris]
MALTPRELAYASVNPLLSTTWLKFSVSPSTSLGHENLLTKYAKGSQTLPVTPLINLASKQLADEISFMVLTKITKFVESCCGSVVKNTKMLVPTYFHETQCQATTDTNINGLNITSIINKPTAAAIAYGLTNSPITVCKPLHDFLEKLAGGERVFLVGLNFGGAYISLAMELYPSKVSKAVFVAAENIQGHILFFSHRELIRFLLVFVANFSSSRSREEARDRESLEEAEGIFVLRYCGKRSVIA